MLKCFHAFLRANFSNAWLLDANFVQSELSTMSGRAHHPCEGQNVCLDYTDIGFSSLRGVALMQNRSTAERNYITDLRRTINLRFRLKHCDVVTV